MYELEHLNNKIKTQGILTTTGLLELSDVSMNQWRKAMKANDIGGDSLKKLTEGLSRISMAVETILEETDEESVSESFDELKPYFKKSQVKKILEGGTEVLLQWLGESVKPSLDELLDSIDNIQPAVKGTAHEALENETVSRPASVIERVRGEDRTLKRDAFASKSFEELEVEQADQIQAIHGQQ